MNGDDPKRVDGVYVLVRHGPTGRTLGVAPAHHEPFACFRFHDGQGCTRWLTSSRRPRGGAVGGGRGEAVSDCRIIVWDGRAGTPNRAHNKVSIDRSGAMYVKSRE
jgi:hypothetical protein